MHAQTVCTWRFSIFGVLGTRLEQQAALMLPCKHFSFQFSDKEGPQGSSLGATTCVLTFCVLMFYDITTLDEISQTFRICIMEILDWLQWNLSNMGTLGTKTIVLISEVSLFQGEEFCKSWDSVKCPD